MSVRAPVVDGASDTDRRRRRRLDDHMSCFLLGLQEAAILLHDRATAVMWLHCNLRRAHMHDTHTCKANTASRLPHETGDPWTPLRIRQRPTPPLWLSTRFTLSLSTPSRVQHEVTLRGAIAKGRRGRQNINLHTVIEVSSCWVGSEHIFHRDEAHFLRAVDHVHRGNRGTLPSALPPVTMRPTGMAAHWLLVFAVHSTSAAIHNPKIVGVARLRDLHLCTHTTVGGCTARSRHKQTMMCTFDETRVVVPDYVFGGSFGLTPREGFRISHMFKRDEPLPQEMFGLQVLLAMAGSSLAGWCGALLGFQFAPAATFAPGRVGDGFRYAGWQSFQLISRLFLLAASINEWRRRVAAKISTRVALVRATRSHRQQQGGVEEGDERCTYYTDT